MQDAPGEKILIIEDDTDMAQTCRRLFRRAGLEAEAVYDGAEGLKRLKEEPLFTIVLTDLRMPGMDGTEVLRKAKEIRPEVDVIIMTGYGTIQNAIQAMKIGATDYITKPFDKDELLKAVHQILESRGLKREVSRLRQELRTTYGFPNIVGRSAAMERVFAKIRAASAHNSAVLIVGETGTGKDVVARAIHYNSPRGDKPFVPVNCGAIPHDLIESELFGHRKGAFTGASQDTIGLFRAADGGTLFLDEIIEMPLWIQSRLLRVLQTFRVRRVGDVKETPVDVRIVSAMSLTPDEAVREGKLRQELFYRIGVIIIELPSLRERAEDLPFLVEHFIEKNNRVFPNKLGEKVEAQALDLLAAYPWPGNVRELENLIESIFALGASGSITVQDLPEHIRHPRSAVPLPEAAGPTALADAERKAIERALSAAHGNKSRAAAMLGISRTRLYNKLKQYGLGPGDE